MSQNDKLLLKKGIPVLTKNERAKLRGEWQAQTWDDMLLSLHNYGKYIMLRPTGFGKTYTSAAACNIGHLNEEAKALVKACNIGSNSIKLNNGNIVENTRLSNIHKKKVVFVYVSEILKNTFDKYVNNGMIVRGKERVVYETYASVAAHWGDPEYLKNTLDIKNVGLIIFDEAQRMGAIKTSKALEKALKIFNKLGIYYIGATATPERSTGYDVIDKYFRHNWEDGRHTYCWGEHLYTLNDAFKSGLIIPPEYQYIIDDPKKIKKYRGELRQTKQSMLAELKTMDANNPNRDILIRDMKEMQSAVIKDADKIIHDTMIKLYDCDNRLITNQDKLKEVPSGSLQVPERLPRYMRFIVFTPSQEDLKSFAKTKDSNGAVKVFENMVARTYNDFHSAFGRYGYKVRTTIVSSANSIEKDNVNVIDPTEEMEALIIKKRKIVTESEAEQLFVKKDDLTIDLIFSINMLNVGYHVDSITGLVFKRWTASNQIYYQQLGRCLSSASDIIPVVFDFVNALDDRGINAPLYTYDKSNSVEVTENADGTKASIDTDADRKVKKSSGTFNKITLDNEGVVLPHDLDGNPVNPHTLNNVSTQYIIFDTASASVDKILARTTVYQQRTTAKKLHNLAYDIYKKSIVIHGKHIDIHNTMRLDDALRFAIMRTEGPSINYKNLTVNFKAFVEFLKNKEKEVFITYDALEAYINGTLGNSKFSSLESEVNTLLASSRSKSNIRGTKINVVVHKDRIEEMRNNKEVIELLKSKCFNPSTDLYYYE